MRGGSDRGRARDDAAASRKRAPAPQTAPPTSQPTQQAPEAAAPPVETAAAGTVSCQALCAMHMVEICNTDKVLWSAHRARWEPTPCGMRRGEPFLAQCYQEQWDTGTFDTSCVQPCEASDAGRSRLTAILQEAGCVAGPGRS
jgi:hypothetical protein